MGRRGWCGFGSRKAVGADVAGCAIERQAQQVVKHEDLAVAARAGSDADRGDAERVGHLLGHFGGHAFEHDREGPGLLGGLGVD